MRRLALIAIAAVLCATPLRAQPAPVDTRRLLLDAGSPEDLRARLSEHARTVESTNRDDAAEALYTLGLSCERAGLRDSAIASYRHAIELRRGHDERLALVDALLLRRGPGDVEAAIEHVRQGREAAITERGAVLPEYAAREAWALFLADRADTALALMAELDYGLRRTPQWRYREARVEIKAGSPRKAFWLLFPLAVASRLQDKEVMGLIGQISAAARVGSRLQDEVEKAIALSDRNEQRLLGELHAHRLRYTARDGVALGAVVFPPAGTARRRAALVLMAPGDSASDYDSLAVALRRAGLAVMLMDVRGSGWSVDAGCPLPDAWRGREERLNTLVARDVRTALNALAKDLPIDTTRYLVAGVGASASIAVQAATLDRRVAALLLVSPNAPPVEHGPMRARLAEIRLPVFFQIAPDDRENFALTDDLFHACNERKSRIAEARAMGHGPLQYHQDPAVALRLTRWLKETMPGPVRPAPRPPTPRRE